MARQVNWYLNGWVYDTVAQKGHVKKVLVYKGAYYSFNLSTKGLRILKAGYLLLALTIYVVFYLFATNGSQGAETFYSGIPGMLSIIPFIYLGMGVFCLMFAKDKMTYRSYYASVKRITYSARASIILLGLCILGEILFIALHASGTNYDMNAELQRLLGALFCAAAAGAALYLQKRFPVSIASAPNDQKP